MLEPTTIKNKGIVKKEVWQLKIVVATILFYFIFCSICIVQ